MTPPRRVRLVEAAHALILPHLRPGCCALDATAGAGFDTLFLAQGVGSHGQVWACDIQPTALAQTRARLERAGCADRVTLVATGHEHLDAWLPPSVRLAAVMFNLGYLPGGRSDLVTRPETTCQALDAAAERLEPTGRITIIAYRGHAGGDTEAQQVAHWSQDHAAAGWQTQQPMGDGCHSQSPLLFTLAPPA